jgi:hypothetical protein
VLSGNGYVGLRVTTTTTNESCSQLQKQTLVELLGEEEVENLRQEAIERKLREFEAAAGKCRSRTFEEVMADFRLREEKRHAATMVT